MINKHDNSLIGPIIGVIVGLVVVVAVLLLVTVATGILVMWLLRRRRKSAGQTLPQPVYDEVNREGMELDANQNIRLKANEAYGNRDDLRQQNTNVSEAYEYVR